MPPSARPVVAGLVLAAGASSRLGRPKQLLPFGRGTLLGHVLDEVRGCPLDQRLVALGAGAEAVRRAVDLHGFEVALVQADPTHPGGCSSSIAAALPLLDPRCELLVLLLGDQPGAAAAAGALLAGRGAAPLAVCGYEDGRGHPLAFARPLFGELAALHGDKAVWKLLDRHAGEVAEVPVAGPVPRDVDTWADYEALRAS